MIELTTKVIAVTIDSSFVQARPFSKEWLDQVGVRSLDLFKANGLQPEHIKLPTADVERTIQHNRNFRFALAGRVHRLERTLAS
jgi:hypothetical protein